MGPRWPQEAISKAKMVPGWPQEGERVPQDGAKWAQEGSMIAPTGPQDRSKRGKDSIKMR